MTSRSEFLEIKLSQEEYQVIYITSLKRNISLHEAMSLLITSGARVLVDEETVKKAFEETLEPIKQRLDTIDAMISHLSGNIADSSYWNTEYRDDIPVADVDQ